MLGEDDVPMLRLSETENKMEYESDHINIIESNRHRHLPIRDGEFSRIEDGVQSPSLRQPEYIYEAKSLVPK